LVAAPRIAVFPAIASAAIPILLFAPPPKMNPAAPAIAIEASGSSLMYSPRVSSSRSRCRFCTCGLDEL